MAEAGDEASPRRANKRVQPQPAVPHLMKQDHALVCLWRDFLPEWLHGDKPFGEGVVDMVQAETEVRHGQEVLQGARKARLARAGCAVEVDDVADRHCLLPCPRRWMG